MIVPRCVGYISLDLIVKFFKKKIKILVENQCNFKIKTLRFGNGGKYISGQFVKFCKS